MSAVDRLAEIKQRTQEEMEKQAAGTTADVLNALHEGLWDALDAIAEEVDAK